MWQFSLVYHCQLYGKPLLVALHIAGDLATFIAYVTIPIAILIVMRRRDLKFTRLAALFAAFIVSCGFGHLIDVITLYYPIPWGEAAIKIATGAVSLVTAILAVMLVPVIISQDDWLQHSLESALSKALSKYDD